MRDHRRRHDDEEHENHERWLITYADMITLLLALFMMLYAMSVLDLKKFQAFREAFNNGPRSGVQAQGLPEEKNPPEGDPNTQVPGQPVKASRIPPAEPAPAVARKDTVALKRKLEKAIADVGLRSKVSVTLDDRGVVVFVTDGVLFDSGQAQLLPVGQRLLNGLAPVFASVGNELDVEGHTDDRPIASAAYPSNWELSTSRSTTVLRFLLARPGIAPRRVSASGYADTRPRVPNDSAAHRATNRRVEVVVVVPPARAAPATAAAPAAAARTQPAGH